MNVMDIRAMPVAEVLDIAGLIADGKNADCKNADCEALLLLYGADICGVLRAEVLRLAARPADNSLTVQRDAAIGLLAEVWHEIATGRPPPVSDRTAWLAQVGDVVGAASYCAALAAARDALTREMDALRDAAREYLAARDGWELSRVLGSTAARVKLDALDAARARLAALVGGAS